MSTIEHHRHADPVAVRRAVRGAAIGNTVEWFDFAIYGFLATYIADKFFPPGDETAALLNTFAISPPPSSCGRSVVSSSDRSRTGSAGNGCSPS